MALRWSNEPSAASIWGWVGAGAALLAAWAALSGQAWAAAPALASGAACVMLMRAALRPRPNPAPAAPPEPQQTGLDQLVPFLESLPEPALLIDDEGRVAGSNAAAREQFEFEAAGLILSSLLRNPDLLDAVRAAAQDGAARTVEYETATHVEQHTRCYVAPVTWGDARAAMMVFHDQTARINTERMRADFLANASHELRTPLTALSLLLETLQGPAREDAADRDRFVAMMQVQVERMRRLIYDLLSLSRIELDEHVPPSDRADLTLVASEVADVLTPVAAERGVALKVSAAGPAFVIGERFQLAQVVQNLIDNAIKYSPSGTAVEVEIGRADSREEAMDMAGKRWEDAGRIALLTPAAAPNSGYAFVRVVDVGPGVERRFLPRLGARFFRVERETGEEKGGTGLGLAIVKHIINRHRGGLMVESQPGRGSAFAIYLELADEPAPKPRAAAEKITPLSTPQVSQ